MTLKTMWPRSRAFLARHRTDVGILIVLLLVAGFPRLLDLGVFLTADEKNWMGRSFEFVRAFSEGRFNDMLQTTHPGVTTLWLVGLAIYAKAFTSGIPFSFDNLWHFVKAAQFPIAVLSTVMVGMIYVLLRRLFSARPAALLGALLVALDPWLIGYSRVAHVDALLAYFLFAAALSTILYRYVNYSRRWLVLSAILSAAAILTKAPAIFLIPFLFLVIVTDRRNWQRRARWQRSKDVLFWLLIIAVLFVALWPAVLWVPDPKGNALAVKKDLAIAAATPHDDTQNYSLNIVHYPLTLLTRTTPITLVFSLVTIGTLLGLWRRGKADTRSWFLVAYVFFFMLMMTLGAKKGDRYILPVWPALDVLAALGVLMVVRARAWRAISWRLKLQWWTVVPHHLFIAMIILYLLVVVVRYHPYAGAYTNPLFPDNLSQERGWGEGLEHVADWLNTNAPNASVASWYPEELGAYTSARVAHINAHEQTRVRYVVLYRNMFGRPPEHYANNFIDEYFTKREPIFTAYVHGEPFAWVYEKYVVENIVGELTSGSSVGQTLAVASHPVAGLDIFFATYSGRAKQGEVVVRLRDTNRTGKMLYEWRVPMSQLRDTTWTTLLLPAARSLPLQVYVEITAQGTSVGNAPTIRFGRAVPFHTGTFDHGVSTKEGDLALRWRYLINGQQATEEDTKLLNE